MSMSVAADTRWLATLCPEPSPHASLRITHGQPMSNHNDRTGCLTTHCKKNDKTELQIKPVIIRWGKADILQPKALVHNKVDTSSDSVHTLLAQSKC